MPIVRSSRRLALSVFAVLLSACAPAYDGESEEGDDETADTESALQDEVRFDVITHNIAGGMLNYGRVDALDNVEKEIAKARPDVVLLQEVCQTQADAFAASHPAWDVEFRVTRPSHPKCGPLGHLLASHHGLGDVTETDLGHADPGKSVTLLCGNVKFEKRKGSVRACSTHLVSRNADDPEDSDRRRALEVDALVATLNPIVNGGKAVVIAGDFNSGPRKEALDPIYRLKRNGNWGGGLFDEADQTDARRDEHREQGVSCAPGACRSGEPTHGTNKLDHVFFSANRISGAIEGRVLNKGKSDHNLYRASAILRLPAR
jgi:endonuclease/exonuclease/phosphatase family metal-dependent hydrolase